MTAAPDSIVPLSSSKGQCTGCDTRINAALARGEKPPHRGDATWALTRNGKTWWLCAGCVSYAAHVYGIVCGANPTGAKTIIPQIPLVPRTPVAGATP